MTKIEVYNLVIDFQRKHAIGLPGLVVLGNNGQAIKLHLQSLIEEGHIIKYDYGSSTSSIGAPEASMFYITTKGYNVWSDNIIDGFCTPLNCVRLYLDIHEHVEKGLKSSENKLNPGYLDCIRNVEFMNGYTKWLKKNEDSLKELLSLKPVEFLELSEIILTKEEIDFLVARSWYKKNKTVMESLKLSHNHLQDEEALLNIIIKLQKLYENHPNDKYALDLKKNSDRINSLSKEVDIRKKLHNIMETCTKEESIQSFFAKILSDSTSFNETNT